MKKVIEPVAAAITPKESAEFPVSFAEFCQDLDPAKREMNKAFAVIVAPYEQSQKRKPSEWAAIFAQFRNKPVGTTWAEWSAPEPTTDATITEGRV
jgi:hypothetical protein